MPPSISFFSGVVGGGGSQTPWTSNIDADGFDLLNAATIRGESDQPVDLQGGFAGDGGNGANISAGGATGNSGGSVVLQAGVGVDTGDGGNVIISPVVAQGSGTDGVILLEDATGATRVRINDTNTYVASPIERSAMVVLDDRINLTADEGAGNVNIDGTLVMAEGKSLSGSAIDTTAGDAAEINTMAGRFRKDTSGATFTLTNSLITANSIVMLQIVTVDATATRATVVAGAGSAVITFDAAPTGNVDVNFWVVN